MANNAFTLKYTPHMKELCNHNHKCTNQPCMHTTHEQVVMFYSHECIQHITNSSVF